MGLVRSHHISCKDLQESYRNLQESYRNLQKATQTYKKPTEAYHDIVLKPEVYAFWIWLTFFLSWQLSQ